MIEMYLFIKRNRSRKKRKIYKQAAQLSFDMTIIFYVLLVLGYMLFAVIAEGNLWKHIQNNIGFLNKIEIRTLSTVFLILPAVYLFQSFNHPGINFSSTEYKWSIQPVSKLRIWWLLAINKWLQAAFIYTIIGLFFSIFTTIPIVDIIFYVLLLFILNIVMTPIQWKFFRFSLLGKIGIFIPILFVIGISFLWSNSYIWILWGSLFMILYYISLKNLMKQVPWEKVTAAADFKIWNMIIISQMTKVKFEKPGKYSLLQRLPIIKQPFRYHKNMMFHRLWRLHTSKNGSHIFQLSGVLFLFLIVAIFLKQWLFLIALMITAQIYNELMASLFQDRFREEIVSILPWDMNVYRDTFKGWAFAISTIFLIPNIVYIVKYDSLVSVVQVLLFIILFLMQLLETLDKQISIMDKAFTYKKSTLGLSTLGMLFIFLSHFQPLFLMLTVCIVIALLVMNRKST